jgi:4-diphosphocytidyl-2-C-methyl-D-erythritol kinase
MGSLVARCPAKVNLALKVLGRRDDGYHELDTVFQAIDLWDEIRIEPGPRIEMRCDQPGLACDGSNLVLRAALLLREAAGRPLPGALLDLRKRIPLQAGLGGGSSNAAGALLLCCRFWDLDPGRAELEKLAVRLGADVPFFLVGGTARGRGRGDAVEPLPFIGDYPLLLGIPPFGISTAEVFSRVGRRLTLPGNGVSLPLLLAHKWPVENDFRFAVNDLETIVFDAWPELRRFRDGLGLAGARSALLSGSGSVVYGVFAEIDQRDAVADRLRGEFRDWTLVATSSIDDAAYVSAGSE